eukprot:gene6541-4716_t
MDPKSDGFWLLTFFSQIVYLILVVVFGERSTPSGVVLIILQHASNLCDPGLPPSNSTPSSAIPSEPTVCNDNGEVVFGDASGMHSWRSFQVTFNSPKDARNLTFAIYDFTSRRSPTKIVGFSVPLSGMCSVLAGESICDCKGVAFKFTGQSCRLDTIFCMYPVGQPEPPLKGSAQATTTSSGGGAKTGSEGKPGAAATAGGEASDTKTEFRTTRLPDSAVRALQQGGLVPRGFTAVELDLDMANEIAARAEILFPSREDLEKRVKALRIEVARLEYEENYGNKDLVKQGSAAAAVLREEYTFWAQRAEAIDEKAAHDAGLLPPVAKAAGSSAATLARIKELEKAIQEEQAKLTSLEAEQSKRDVTTEALKILQSVEELELQLADLRGAGTMKPRYNKKMWEIYDVEGGDFWDKLAAELYDAESNHDQLHQEMLSLNRLQYPPYPAGIESQGTMHEVPKELDFVKNNPRNLANSSGAILGGPAMKAGVAKPTDNNLLDDLFGPTAAPTTEEPAAAPADAVDAVDPFGFGAAAPAAAVAAQVTPIWATNGPAPTSPASVDLPSALPEEGSAVSPVAVVETVTVPAQDPEAQGSGEHRQALPNLHAAQQQGDAGAPTGVSPTPPSPAPSTDPEPTAAQQPATVPAQQGRGASPPFGHTEPVDPPLTQIPPPPPSPPPPPPAMMDAATEQKAAEAAVPTPNATAPTQTPPLPPSPPPPAMVDAAPSQQQQPAAAPPMGAPHASSSSSSAAPAVAAAVPVMKVPQQQQQQQQHLHPAPAPSPPQPQQPALPAVPPGPPPPPFERRPPSLEEIPFTRFFNIDLMGRGCPIDIYLDGKTPTRGTEVTIVNNTPNDILIGGIELKQEDIFASGPPKTIPTKRWPQQARIPGNGHTETFIIALHPSFPRASALMVLINVYVLVGTKYMPFSSRFTV